MQNRAGKCKPHTRTYLYKPAQTFEYTVQGRWVNININQHTDTYTCIYINTCIHIHIFHMEINPHNQCARVASTLAVQSERREKEWERECDRAKRFNKILISILNTLRLARITRGLCQKCIMATPSECVCVSPATFPIESARTVRSDSSIYHILCSVDVDEHQNKQNMKKKKQFKIRARKYCTYFASKLEEEQWSKGVRYAMNRCTNEHDWGRERDRQRGIPKAVAARALMQTEQQQRIQKECEAKQKSMYGKVEFTHTYTLTHT